MAKKRRGNGEGAIYKRNDKYWCGSVTAGYNEHGQRRRRVVYGRTKLEVRDKLKKIQLQDQSSVFFQPKQINVAKYLSHWLEDFAKMQIRESTYIRYEGLIRLHINPFIGGVSLNALTAGHISNLYRKLKETTSSSRTPQFVHAVLHKALKQALKLGYLLTNPCTLIERPRHTSKPVKYLNEYEANHFMQEAKADRYYALYVLAITTGLRQGELFGLKWEDLDLKKGALSVRRTMYELNGKMQEGHPKTKSGRRKIELPKMAIEALLDHLKKQMHASLADSWVFGDSTGAALRRSNFRKRSFLPLLEKANIPKIRFHDLRHTAATLLLSQGVHPKVVQERLGHAQIAITLDTYSHILPSMQKEAAQKLDQLFEQKTLQKTGRNEGGSADFGYNFPKN